MKKLEKLMMSLVVGILILIPFTGQSKDKAISDVSTVTPENPDTHTPVNTHPIDTPGTDEYLYNELAKGMR